VWDVKLTPLAKRQLKRLDEDIRLEAVNLLLDLEDGIFPSDKVRLRKYERYERVKFARNRFRIIYRINRKLKTILLTRIRPCGAGARRADDSDGLRVALDNDLGSGFPSLQDRPYILGQVSFTNVQNRPLHTWDHSASSTGCPLRLKT